MPKKKSAAPEWREYIGSWLETLIAGNMRVESVETRRRQLSTLSHGIDADPLTISAEDIVHWSASHQWSAETRRGYRNAISSFFAWLQDSGKREDNPAELLPSIRHGHAEPRPCPDAVILSALSRANAEERVMIRLGAECGLRRSEIAAVNSSDVIDDLLGQSLIVHGKGGKQRIVPIPNDLAKEIRNHSGFVFPGRWTGHVEASYVGKRLSHLLGGGWTAHSLRHRFATMTYAVTHDLFVVSRLLGHESVETTQIYVAMPDERLRAGLDAVILHA